jgi:mono/diheme cytochrome c family protein
MRILLTTLTMAVLAATAGMAADAAAGQTVYTKSCKACHGTDGTPSPGMAKAMNIKDLKSAEVQAMSEDDMKKVITDGKGKMKPVKAVSGADADNVVAYIRGLKK